MSLLSHDELVELVVQGVITNVTLDQINAASIDLTLGSKILLESQHGGTIQLDKKGTLTVYPVDIPSSGIVIPPGTFFLAQSEQMFYLPDNISAEYKLKSSMARIGLEHLNAGWCDAGWHGSVLTLELKNLTRYHEIVIKAGDKIGQVIFFRHKKVPSYASYATKGSYNGDTEVTGTKVIGEVK